MTQQVEDFYLPCGKLRWTEVSDGDDVAYENFWILSEITELVLEVYNKNQLQEKQKINKFFLHINFQIAYSNLTIKILLKVKTVQLHVKNKTVKNSNSSISTEQSETHGMNAHDFVEQSIA